MTRSNRIGANYGSLYVNLDGGVYLMQQLLLLGLNHTTAPLEVREKLAFDAASRRAAVEAFRARFPGCEAVLLSTCNRVELYTARSPAGSSAAPVGVRELVEFLSTVHDVPAADFKGHLYHKAGRSAADHLFSVASSLDSMVLGEAQILGQVRDAYDLAVEVGSAGAMLHPLFQRALAAGKQVRTDTELAEGRLSVASVAVSYASRIFEHFGDKTVLCIGAGKMAALVLQNFVDLSPGRLLVCNRDPEKARALAARFGGAAVPFDRMADHLVAADIVVSSTGAAAPIITRRSFEALLRRRRYRPAFVIDIAVPRDVESTVGDLENVYLYNVDDLQQVVQRTQSQRKGAVDAAAAIVARHVEEFVAWDRQRELGPMIDRLYKRYHHLAREEMGRTVNKLTGDHAADTAAVEEMARRLVNKLLHHPVQALRQNQSLHAGATYLHAMEKLFDLEESAIDEDAPAGPPEEAPRVATDGPDHLPNPL